MLNIWFGIYNDNWKISLIVMYKVYMDMEGPWITNHWKYRDLDDQNSSKGVDMTNFQNLRDYK
jgi:hypothetical protein